MEQTVKMFNLELVQTMGCQPEKILLLRNLMADTEGYRKNKWWIQ